MDSKFNRFLYVAFVLFSLYYVLVQKNYSDAVMMLGIALAFDPFDAQQTWKERPLWQKVVLIVHLAAVAALFGWQVGFNDR
jgi:hypothetical protein